MPTIEENIRDSIAAENLYMTIGGLILPEVEKLPSEESRAKFWELLRQSCESRTNAYKRKWHGSQTASTTPPPQQKSIPKKIADLATVEEAQDLAEEIQSLADDIPSAGEEFSDSVLEKTRSIMATIEERGSATGCQLTALENMRDGLSRWHR